MDTLTSWETTTRLHFDVLVIMEINSLIAKELKQNLTDLFTKSSK